VLRFGARFRLRGPVHAREDFPSVAAGRGCGAPDRIGLGYALFVEVMGISFGTYLGLKVPEPPSGRRE
jgi:hypothetical protein